MLRILEELLHPEPILSALMKVPTIIMDLQGSRLICPRGQEAAWEATRYLSARCPTVQMAAGATQDSGEQTALAWSRAVYWDPSTTRQECPAILLQDSLCLVPVPLSSDAG